jgi:hypothetical protein
MVHVRYDVERCLSHPVFWKSVRRFRFISEIVRTGKHLRLPSNERLGLGRDWREALRADGTLSAHMQASPSSYGPQPSDFLRLCRNFYQHPPMDSHIRSDPFENVAEDLAKFPSLVTALFGIFGEDDNLL